MEHKSYKDIERLKESFYDGFRVGDIISITEKIDGANSSYQYDTETDSLVSFSRRKTLDFQNTLQGFYEFVSKLDKERYKKYPNLRFFGEWLVKHTIVYRDEAYKNFYCFDIYDMEKNGYLLQTDVKKICKELDITYVPEFYYGAFKSWEHVKSFVGKSIYAINGGEGVVVKNDSRINSTDKIPYYTKIVAADFIEKKKVKVKDLSKLEKRSQYQILAESIVTEPRVRKQLNILIEDNIIPNDWDEHNMREIAQNIPKMVYNDCIKEEKETVDMIEDFGKFSGKISMDIVRKILLNR